MTAIRRSLPLAAVVLAVACGDEPQRLPPTNTNNNTVDVDAGTSSTPDAGAADPDAGMAPADAGMTLPPSVIETLDLGTVMTGALGDSSEITFDLPEGTTSFMVVLEGPDATNFIVKRLNNPAGDVLVSDDDSNVSMIEAFLLGPFAAQFKSPNRVIQDLGRAAALFPNNPDVVVGAGTYTMVISGITISGQQGTPYAGEVAVRILYRLGEPTAGILPVTLYFSGAGDVTADSAPMDPFIQEAITEMGNIYAQANVRLGDIAYRDIDARYRTIPLGAGDAGLMEEMFKQSAGEGPGLHFFFIDRFEGGFGGGVAGVSGGLPGPALSTGTVNSGVAVAITSVMGDSGVLAHVMAHEGGHWLGLFHTSEFTGTTDQLPDTPEGQAGENHLMYPAVGGGTMVSPTQGDVIRRHMETISE